MERDVSKEKIMELTNNEKRRGFALSYEDWPVWLEVPELKMVVRRIDFPDGSSFCAALYESTRTENSNTANQNRPRYCILHKPEESFRPGDDCLSMRVEHLTALRKQLVAK